MNEISADSSAKSNSTVGDGAPVDSAALALKSSVTADAHDLADKAKEVSGGVIDHARQSAEATISGGKDRVAEGLTSVADAIRHTGEQLKAQDKAGITEYVVRVADQVEAASGYLQGRSIGAVLTDVGSFARREPAIFLGSAFALGLVGGRFLKSSTAKPAPHTAQGAQGGVLQHSGGGSHQTQQRPKAPRLTPHVSAPRPQGAPGSSASENGNGNGGLQTKSPGAV